MRKLDYINHFDKILENPRLAMPCTPSKWLSKPRSGGMVTCITMSCGGGIGGSRWDIYAMGDIRDLIQPVSIISMTDEKGHVQQLNTNFVVCTQLFEIVEVDFHSENDRLEYLGDHTLRYLVWPGKAKNVYTVDTY